MLGNPAYALTVTPLPSLPLCLETLPITEKDKSDPHPKLTLKDKAILMEGWAHSDERVMPAP